MAKKMGAIYAVRNDRLGGRLGAMLNAKRIADDYGAAFRFTWASHQNVSPELQQPEMLFSADFMARHLEQDRTFGDLQKNTQGIEALPPQTPREAFWDHLSAGVDFRCNEAMRAVAMPWEDTPHIAGRVAETLETIGFVPQVVDAINTIRSRLGSANLIAYHLRRGDIIDPDARPSNVLWPDKYLPRVFYEAHIKRVLKQNPDTRVVVFSDSEHELAAFTEISDRVIPAPSLIPTDSLHILQCDFLELYTMSRCRHIIGPSASAFSSVAAILGNGTITDIKAALSPEEHDEALNELTRRLDSQPEIFAGNADLGQNFPELITFHRKNQTEGVARHILQKNLDAGFTQSYIYDLLAEEYFLADDVDNVLNLIETLGSRPILTDLGNSPSYVWAGLAALAAGRTAEAARLGHIGHWLQPLLPISRILISGLSANGLLARDNQYPIPQDLIVHKPTGIKKFRQILQRIAPGIAAQTNHAPEKDKLDYIPFELDIREWFSLQTTRLPSAFWNIPNQRKMIGFFHSSFRFILQDPSIISVLGQLYCQADDEATGTPMIEGAHHQSPDDAFVNLRLARLRMRQARYKKAQQLYDRAVGLSGGQICFRAEQGIVRLQLGDKSGAIDIFSELAQVDHQMIELLLLTADVLRRTDKYREEALRIAEKADRLAPGGTRSTQVLRKVLQQLGRKKEAEAIRTKLLAWKRVPGNFSSRITRIK